MCYHFLFQFATVYKARDIANDCIVAVKKVIVLVLILAIEKHLTVVCRIKIKLCISEICLHKYFYTSMAVFTLNLNRTCCVTQTL